MGFATAARACVGDCDGDGEVTVNEIVSAVNIALDVAALSACPSADRDGDGAVTVDEIVVAINNALNGCPTPTATPVAPSPTTTAATGATLSPTPTPPPANATATATVTKTTAAGTATPTETVTTGATALTCHFVAGSSQLVFQAKTTAVTVDLTGSQLWHFGDVQADGTRELVSLPADSHFDCLSANVLGALQVAGCLRMDPATQGHGVLDCAGGQVSDGYNAVVSIDHNTNQNNDGFPQDPQCAAVYRNPNNDADGELVPSWVEDTLHPHPGVCNSGLHVDQSGDDPAGGLRLTQDLLLRVFVQTSCSPSLCPADDAPFDPTRDLRLTAAMTSGNAKGVIFNYNNTALTFGTTGSGAGASVCGFGGSDACVTSASGTSYAALCSDLSATSLQAGKFVTAFAALDLPSPVYDVIATLGVTCQ